MLDTGPLGMVTNPKSSSAICQECKLWLDNLPLQGYEVMLPEIADYELRRELLRVGKVTGIRRPITTEVMLKAAELWAQARNRGRPTADPKALDGDVILAAQATLVADQGNEVIVATTNLGHLSQFVDAREWQLI